MLYYTITHGQKYVYANGVTSEQLLRAISEYKINSLVISNVEKLRKMVELKEQRPDFNLSFLQEIHVGGITFPAELIQKARNILEAVVTMVCGMSEVGIVTFNHSNKIPSKSVGLLQNNVEVKMTKKEKKAATKKEICVRSPQVMKG